MEPHARAAHIIWKGARTAALSAALTVSLLSGAAMHGGAHRPAEQPQQAPGEQPAAKLAFEVASVKLNTSGDPRAISNVPLGPGLTMGLPTGGRFAVTNQPLRNIIAFAYKMTPRQTAFFMTGLPRWVDTERFDIEAKAEGNPDKDQFREMVQKLLADRFNFAAHHETQQVPVFAAVLVTPGKTGPQIMPHTDDSTCLVPGQPASPPAPGAVLPPLPCGDITTAPPTAPGRIHNVGRKVTMQMITEQLSGLEIFNRPVIDQTGLSGYFDFWMEVAPTFPGPPPPNFTPDPDAPDLTQGLKDQLGLKLESTNGPVDFIVVDRLEQPTEN